MATNTYGSASKRPVVQSRQNSRGEVGSTADRAPLLPPTEVATYSVFHTKPSAPGPSAVVELYGKEKVLLCTLRFWEPGATLPDDAPAVVNFGMSNLAPILDTLRLEHPCFLLSTRDGFWVGATSEPVGEVSGDKSGPAPPPGDGGGMGIDFPGRGDRQARLRPSHA